MFSKILFMSILNLNLLYIDRFSLGINNLHKIYLLFLWIIHCVVGVFPSSWISCLGFERKTSILKMTRGICDEITFIVFNVFYMYFAVFYADWHNLLFRILIFLVFSIDVMDHLVKLSLNFFYVEKDGNGNNERQRKSIDLINFGSRQV